MYDVHIEVESLVYIYVYVGSRTIFFPVMNSFIKTEAVIFPMQAMLPMTLFFLRFFKQSSASFYNLFIWNRLQNLNSNISFKIC